METTSMANVFVLVLIIIFAGIAFVLSIFTKKEPQSVMAMAVYYLWAMIFSLSFGMQTLKALIFFPLVFSTLGIIKWWYIYRVRKEGNLITIPSSFHFPALFLISLLFWSGIIKFPS